MTEKENTSAPDAFKAQLTVAGQETGQPDLAHQSLGRSLSEAEAEFARALMAIYAEGVVDQAEIAKALSKGATVAPTTGSKDWTAESLEHELRELNDDFDSAYKNSGFGA